MCVFDADNDLNTEVGKFKKLLDQRMLNVKKLKSMYY